MNSVAFLTLVLMALPLASTTTSLPSEATQPPRDLALPSLASNLSNGEASSSSSGPGWVLLRRPFPKETAEEVAKRKAYMAQIARVHRQAFLLKQQQQQRLLTNLTLSASTTTSAPTLTPSGKVRDFHHEKGFKRRKGRRLKNRIKGRRNRGKFAGKRAWKRMFRKFWRWLVERRKKRRRRQRQKVNGGYVSGGSLFSAGMVPKKAILSQAQQKGQASPADQQRFKDRDLMLRTFARLKE